MSAQHQQQPQQQQYNRGILPADTLNALDYLVDRLNASSGRLPTPQSPPGNANAPSKDGKSSSGVAPSTANPSSSSSSTSSGEASPRDSSPPPIRALLVGTNEGVGLSRSLGTAHTAKMYAASTDGSGSSSNGFSFSGNMSEEVLSSIETVWATLVSAVSPHVMATTAAAAAASEQTAQNGSNGGGTEEGGAGSNGSNGNDASSAKHASQTTQQQQQDNAPPHIQPPHPLLSPLNLGNTIKTVTATYDNCILMHVHLAPLVITFVASLEANIGAIRCMALPVLKVLLEPVRRALVRSRGVRSEDAMIDGGVGDQGMAGPMGGDSGIHPSGMSPSGVNALGSMGGGMGGHDGNHAMMNQMMMMQQQGQSPQQQQQALQMMQQQQAMMGQSQMYNTNMNVYPNQQMMGGGMVDPNAMQYGQEPQNAYHPQQQQHQQQHQQQQQQQQMMNPQMMMMQQQQQYQQQQRGGGGFPGQMMQGNYMGQQGQQPNNAMNVGYGGGNGQGY